MLLIKSFHSLFQSCLTEKKFDLSNVLSKLVWNSLSCEFLSKKNLTWWYFSTIKKKTKCIDGIPKISLNIAIRYFGWFYWFSVWSFSITSLVPRDLIYIMIIFPWSNWRELMCRNYLSFFDSSVNWKALKAFLFIDNYCMIFSNKREHELFHALSFIPFKCLLRRRVPKE